MRVLVVASTFPRWKDDTEPAFVFELCRRLLQTGVDIDVIAPHAPGAQPMECLDGVNVFRYRYGPEVLEVLSYQGGILANLKRHWYGILMVPFFLLFQLITIRNRLKKQEYDLMHAHWIIPQGLTCVLANLLRGRRRRNPVVCTSHGGDLYALRGWPFNAMKHFVMTRVSRLCVVSRAMKETCVADGINPDHVSVLPMGVDLKNTFIPLANTVHHDRRLVFVGRLVEKKGAAHAIEAVAIIRKTIPDIELLLVGDGPELPLLKLKIVELGLEQNVHFAGSVINQELPFLFASAAVCVMPSVVDSRGDREGLGLVIIEAMGCGCPVVASDLPPIHDIIRHGQNGLLARPGDAVDLADKILHLLRDRELHTKLATNGRESVLSRFDWDVTATEYHQLFEELVAQVKSS